MRKLSVILTAALLIITISACGGNDGFNPDEEITVISREASSGTRGAFDELIGILAATGEGTEDRLFEEAVIVDSTDAVASKVEVDKYAVGYTSLGSVSAAVRAVTVEGVAATTENVQNGNYKISRPFVFATKGEAAGLAADFISFAMSVQGQKTVADRGYIKVDSGFEYVSSNLSGKLILGGSTSVEKLVENLKEEYLLLNPGVDIELQFTGSGTGIKDCIAGKADIAMSSRALKESEKSELTDYIYAIDAIAVIVNPENEITDLSIDNIHDVFVGNLRTWKEIAQTGDVS